jgi:hypothetical protein
VNRAIDPEVQALLDAWAGIKRTVRRAVTLARAALFGRALGATVAFAVVTLLATFARPGATTTGKAKVVITQAFDVTGQPVTRQEWIDRALAATTAD